MEVQQKLDRPLYDKMLSVATECLSPFFASQGSGWGQPGRPYTSAEFSDAQQRIVKALGEAAFLGIEEMSDPREELRERTKQREEARQRRRDGEAE